LTEGVDGVATEVSVANYDDKLYTTVILEDVNRLDGCIGIGETEKEAVDDLRAQLRAE
jgi:hypothetical protein